MTLITPLTKEPLEELPSHTESESQPQEHQVNFTNTLSYLSAVRTQLRGQPKMYNQFLDIMSGINNQTIDTSGVIARISDLFHGHPQLIQRFNTFLPIGYSIEYASDAPSMITVTTPSGMISHGPEHQHY